MTATKPALNIRPVEPTDLKQLVEGETRSHLWYDPDLERQAVRSDALDIDGLMALISEPRTRTLTLLEGRAIVGLLCYELTRDGVILRRLQIHPNFRRNGFASRALEWLAALMQKSQKRRKITVYVHEWDLDSQRFYASLHFRTKLARDHYGPGQDAYQFTFRVLSVRES